MNYMRYMLFFHKEIILGIKIISLKKSTLFFLREFHENSTWGLMVPYTYKSTRLILSPKSKSTLLAINKKYFYLRSKCLFFIPSLRI